MGKNLSAVFGQEFFLSEKYVTVLPRKGPLGNSGVATPLSISQITVFKF
jgi:hypothetical protein